MSTTSRLTIAALAVGLAVTPLAAAAPPQEPALQDRGASAAEGRPTGNLLVTFRDRPDGPTAAARLRAIGTVRPMVPEIGIWQLSPRSSAGSLARAKRAAGVAAVDRVRSGKTLALTRPERPFALAEEALIEDPLYTQQHQWGLFRTDWSSALSSRPRPPIALLDAGLDITHPEWAGAQRPVRRPFSVFKRGSGVSDWFLGHGTHVAGIAAAPANGVGIVGVAPAAKGSGEIVPVQVADRTGRSTDAGLIKGIRHAVRAGAKVISISAGGEGSSRAVADTILWATHRGALVVAAVGNEGDSFNTLNYPAAYPRVLGVGAQCNAKVSLDCPTPYGVAGFSNRNESVDVIAPGVGVVSSVPLGVTDGFVAPGYATKDGTSMATPFVSGVASLVMANNRTKLSPYQVRRHIEDTARDIAPQGRDDKSGHGVVNPVGAVTLPAPPDDVDEVNDEIKFIARRKGILERKPNSPVEAFIDAREDRDDLYAVRLKGGERTRFTLTHTKGRIELYFWSPRTKHIRTTPANLKRNLIQTARRRGTRTQVLEIEPPRNGRYFVNVYARSGGGKYTLTVERNVPTGGASPDPVEEEAVTTP